MKGRERDSKIISWPLAGDTGYSSKEAENINRRMVLLKMTSLVVDTLIFRHLQD